MERGCLCITLASHIHIKPLRDTARICLGADISRCMSISSDLVDMAKQMSSGAHGLLVQCWASVGDSRTALNQQSGSAGMFTAALGHQTRCQVPRSLLLSAAPSYWIDGATSIAVIKEGRHSRVGYKTFTRCRGDAGSVSQTVDRH